MLSQNFNSIQSQGLNGEVSSSQSSPRPPDAFRGYVFWVDSPQRIEPRALKQLQPIEKITNRGEMVK